MGRDDSSYFMNSAARSLIKLTLCVPIPCALCIACDVFYRYVIWWSKRASGDDNLRAFYDTPPNHVHGFALQYPAAFYESSS